MRTFLYLAGGLALAVVLTWAIAPGVTFTAMSFLLQPRQFVADVRARRRYGDDWVLHMGEPPARRSKRRGRR